MTVLTISETIKIAKNNKNLTEKEEMLYVLSVSTSVYDYYTYTNMPLADTVTDIADTVTFRGIGTTDKYMKEDIIMGADFMEPIVFFPGDGNTVITCMGGYTVATNGISME